MTSSSPRMNCEQVEVLIGARLDGSLDLDDRGRMDAHIAGCTDCRSMVSDVERLVADARVLPPLTPSRDLWREIEANLGGQDAAAAPHVEVQSLAQFREQRRTFSYRGLAAAAVLLIAVTAGVTWNLARVGDDAVVPQVAAGSEPATTGTGSIPPAGQIVVTPEPTAPGITEGRRPRVAPAATDSFELRRAALEARYVARSDEDVDAIYEREIAALRTIVDERFTELDSTTVSELRKNLDIIDRAIIDSKAALRRDPRSKLLSRQLDRAIEHKMELLRRVALL